MFQRLCAPLMGTLLIFSPQSSQAAVSLHAYLKASNTDAADLFGFSIANTDDLVVVGAPNETGTDEGDTGEGAVYVYQKSGSTTQFVARLKANNADAGDGFGASVALSGDTLVVGAPQEGSLSGSPGDNSGFSIGAVYVFVRDNTGSWIQNAYLKPSNLAKSRSFGRSVALEGDVLVIGTPFDFETSTGSGEALGAGAAYVFERQAGVWQQTAYLKPAVVNPDDEFGISVDVSGGTVVVGAPGEDIPGVSGANPGAAHVFVKGMSTWSLQAHLQSSASPSVEGFGTSVSVSGDTLAVGSFVGPTDILLRTGSTWSLQTALPPSGTGSLFFGATVDLNGDRLLVGDTGDSSIATGVDGQRDNTDAEGSGAAYLFERNGATWNLLHYLKASNTGSFDVFGRAASQSGNVLVVGAPFESSDAIGINGPQYNNNAPRSGAAYMFERSSFRSVGGRLQGLSPDQNIEIQLNGQEILTMHVDGGFLFQSLLESGQSYRVSIHALPEGQQCTLSNESGVLSGINRNDVLVTCVSDNLRTIGAIVTGLATGASVVLSNNDTNFLTVPTSGEFTFNQGQEDGTSYVVSVHTQPVDQTCAVTNGIGVISGENISNILVACNGGFTVGGSLIGLQAGNAVRLLNNGSDELDIGTNRTFTFPTPLADGAS
jgi:hypothetical protein